jgi:hypothetical protein
MDFILPSLRAKRSNPGSARGTILDCFVAEPVIGLAGGETRWLLAMTVVEREIARAALGAREPRALREEWGDVSSLSLDISAPAPDAG